MQLYWAIYPNVYLVIVGEKEVVKCLDAVFPSIASAESAEKKDEFVAIKTVIKVKNFTMIFHIRNFWSVRLRFLAPPSRWLNITKCSRMLLQSAPECCRSSSQKLGLDFWKILTVSKECLRNEPLLRSIKVLTQMTFTRLFAHSLQLGRD